LKIARLPRLYRLMRMARLVKILKMFKKSIIFQKIQDFFQMNTGAVRMTTFFITVMTCVHLVGCMWVLNASYQDYGPETWVSQDDLHTYDNYSIYIGAIYWAFTTLLTVGYGDISAATNEEMGIAIAWMVIGGFFYTFTIGNLSSVLSNLDTRENNLRDKLGAAQ